MLVDVLVGHLPPSPAALPGRHAHRRAGAGAGRRADPRGGAGGRPRRAAALDRRRGRGDAAAAEDRPTRSTIYADLYVERHSQKAIVIGTGASRLREVGTRPAPQIEELLGTRVYLDLHVRVAKDWQRDPKQLRRLGF